MAVDKANRRCMADLVLDDWTLTSAYPSTRRIDLYQEDQGRSRASRVGPAAMQSRRFNNVAYGSFTSFWLSDHHFRSTPTNGHRPTGPACLKRANRRRRALHNVMLLDVTGCS